MNLDKSYTEYQELSRRLEKTIKDGLKETRCSDDNQRAKFVLQRVLDVLDPILDFKDQ